MSAHILGPPGVVTLVVVLLLTDAGEILRRARDGAALLAEAGPLFVAAVLTWACRGRSPSRAHLAARAAERCQCDACTDELSPVDFAEWERDVRAGRQA